MSEQRSAWERGILRWRYLVIALVILLLAFGLIMRGVLRDKAVAQDSYDQVSQELNQAEAKLSKLNDRLATVGTDGHIENVARQSYSFLRKEEQRFEITNPEFLDGYTYEEMRILLEERNYD